MFRNVLYDQRGAILLLLFLYIQSQLFEAGSNLKRPTEHSIVGCGVLRLIPIGHLRMFKTEYLR